MRFISPFRVAKYQRFEIKPRYYDPVKEEMEKRRKQIREAQESGSGDYRPDIKFERKSHASMQAGFLRLLIAAGLSVMVVGWLYYGDIALYGAAALIPLYLIVRLRAR